MYKNKSYRSPISADERNLGSHRIATFTESLNAPRYSVMDPALRGHVTGDGEQTIGQIHTRGEHGRFVFLLMGLMPTAGRLICNQIVWVRFPQCPRWATRWLRVKKMNNVPVMTNGIV